LLFFSTKDLFQGDQEYNDLARELLNIGRQFRR